MDSTTYVSKFILRQACIAEAMRFRAVRKMVVLIPEEVNAKRVMTARSCLDTVEPFHQFSFLWYRPWSHFRIFQYSDFNFVTFLIVSWNAGDDDEMSKGRHAIWLFEPCSHVSSQLLWNCHCWVTFRLPYVAMWSRTKWKSQNTSYRSCYGDMAEVSQF